MAKDIKIDDVSFNAEHFSEMSEAEFIDELSGEGYKHIFLGTKNREDKLKEVYAQIKKAVKADEDEPTEPAMLPDNTGLFKVPEPAAQVTEEVDNSDKPAAKKSRSK